MTITPTGEAWPGEKREISRQSLLEISDLRDSCLNLSLQDPRLLGPAASGCFIIQVRSRLGQDATFRLCILPEMTFHFSPEALLPDPNNGSQDFAFTLKSFHLRGLAVEPPAEVVPQDFPSQSQTVVNQVIVPAESDKVVLHPHFFVEEQTIEVPLEISIPRFRWTVSGLSDIGSLHWHDTLLKISLQALEGAQAPRLLVRGDFGRGISCKLFLQGTDQQRIFELNRGNGGSPLSPFLDSLRESGLLNNRFVLEYSLPRENTPRYIPLLQVETTWIGEQLEVEAGLIENGTKRIVLLSWRNKGGVKNRMLRLWSLSSKLREPIEVSVEDGQSEAEIEKSLTDFPPGEYRLEFAILDP